LCICNIIIYSCAKEYYDDKLLIFIQLDWIVDYEVW
jgi:hypothetical protein